MIVITTSLVLDAQPMEYANSICAMRSVATDRSPQQRPSRMAWCVSGFAAIRSFIDSLMPSANSRFRIWAELKRAILLLKLLTVSTVSLSACLQPVKEETAQRRLTLIGLMFVELRSHRSIMQR